jgi:hypothetical protein
VRRHIASHLGWEKIPHPLHESLHISTRDSVATPRQEKGRGLGGSGSNEFRKQLCSNGRDRQRPAFAPLPGTDYKPGAVHIRAVALNNHIVTVKRHKFADSQTGINEYVEDGLITQAKILIGPARFFL